MKEAALVVQRTRGPSSVRRTLAVSKATLGKCLRDGVECIIMGFSEGIYIPPN